MENICFIVGAGDFSEGKFEKGSGGLIIAADGGYDSLNKSGVNADLVLGDFDSTVVPKHDNVISFPVNKDDTDMMLAVKAGLEKGYKNFILLGGLGGRLDHTLSNIQALVFLSRQGARGYLVSGNTAITAISDSCISFSQDEKGIISVFCSGDKAEGVYLKGLKYPLVNAVLTDDMPLGVSNEFTGTSSEISVRKGTLVILWQGSLEKIIKS